MILTKSNTTNAYPHLRFTSENNIWEVGIGELTLFGGIRIVAGKVGSGCYEINYCAGADKGTAIGILTLVMAVMVKIPENITPGDFRQIFPIQNIKPMINDLDCWENLLRVVDSV